MYVSLPSNYCVCYQYVQICFISCMAIFGMTFFHFKVIFRLGGSALRSILLLFYMPFWTEKVPLWYTFY